MDTVDHNNWSDEIEEICEKLRVNMESMNCFDDNEEDMADRVESKKFQNFSSYYQHLEQSQRDIDNLEVRILYFQ